MKIILNEDVKYLGEEGDVKIVTPGYARNYLLPRKLAVPYNDLTVTFFESRKEEIEQRKQAKRNDAAGVKERLEAAVVIFSLSAGPTGKLYGAVTNQTVADELGKQGFDVDRKRIEVPGLTIKHTGKYTVTVHLYENQNAAVTVQVNAMVQERTPSRAPQRPRRRRWDSDEEVQPVEATPAPVEECASAVEAEGDTPFDSILEVEGHV
ncbi:MAG: 50S ribosomal protein L9 [Spirochaetaceae bacterium]|jgi:large subunit ribosomal protein L9|nr:50S ribosomal protein L9 [Spirochaetaceae bacterium]